MEPSATSIIWALFQSNKIYSQKNNTAGSKKLTIYNLRPRRPPLRRVLSVGMGVTSSTMTKQK
jgi:hypothetical protein